MKSDRNSLVPVMLLQPHKGFNAGERPGFDATEAAALVKAQAAVYIDQGDDGEYAATGNPAKAKRR